MLRTTFLAVSTADRGRMPRRWRRTQQPARRIFWCAAPAIRSVPVQRIAIGPVLNGVVGRKAGTYPGFEYSDANKNSGIVWTPEELDKYLTSPQTVVPHTKMIFPGLTDAQKRKDVIAFLEQFGPDGQKKQ